MPVPLMPLPFSLSALEPHLSSKTLKLHHGAHHKDYVDKTNAAIRGTGLSDAPLNRIVTTAKAAKDNALFNPAAQAWNHGFYWHSLSPTDTVPSTSLQDAIVRDFGSITSLRKGLSETALAHFGSGWAWLVASKGKLEIITTHDAETPLTGKSNPLLVIDVWEHAYYLDHQNERAAYLKAVTEDLLDWTFASDNFERETPWEYPAST